MGRSLVAFVMALEKYVLDGGSGPEGLALFWPMALAIAAMTSGESSNGAEVDGCGERRSYEYGSMLKYGFSGAYDCWANCGPGGWNSCWTDYMRVKYEEKLRGSATYIRLMHVRLLGRLR
jgi:hypothetical protein